MKKKVDKEYLEEVKDRVFKEIRASGGMTSSEGTIFRKKMATLVSKHGFLRGKHDFVVVKVDGELKPKLRKLSKVKPDRVAKSSKVKTKSNNKSKGSSKLSDDSKEERKKVRKKKAKSSKKLSDDSEDKKVQFNIRIKKSLLQGLKRKAKKQRWSAVTAVTVLIEQYLGVDAG